MKVADLFGELSLKQNKASFSKGQKALEDFKDNSNSILKDLGIFSLASNVASMFTSGARASLDFENSLVTLDVASKGAMGSMTEVRDRILEVSNETGIAKEALLDGSAAFVALTGDGKAAADAMSLFGKVAVASDSELSDIAKTAASLSTNLKIDAKDFEKSFSILIRGGKEGAIELNDMAQIMSGLAPSAAQFADGLGVTGLAKLGAAMQLARRGFGSAKETATGLRALMTSLAKNAENFQKAGVKMFDEAPDGTKTFKAMDEIIQSISNSELAKDPAALSKAFGSSEAQRAFMQLVAVDGEWKSLTESTLSATDVAEDYANKQKAASVKVSVALNKMKNAFVKVFSKIIDIVATLSENFETVILVVGSLAAAYVILNAAAIGAAISAAAAWVVALAPLILLGLLVAALILIVKDLWDWFTGGESVLGDLFEEPLKNWYKLIKDFVNWLIDKFVSAFGWIQEKATDLLDVITPSFIFDKDEIKESKELGDVMKKRKQEAMAREMQRVQRTQSIPIQTKTPVSNAPVSNLTINVESGAVVEEGVAQQIDRANRAALQRTSRNIKHSEGQ